MKKLLFIIIGIFYCLFYAYANEKACSSAAKGFKSELINLKDLDGKQILYYYKCDGCKQPTRVKITHDTKASCRNCGKTREQEVTYSPAIIKKGGESYFLNPDVEVISAGTDASAIAKSGLKHCPYCGTDQFSILSGCASCGASLQNAKTAFPKEYAAAAKKEKRQKNKSNAKANKTTAEKAQTRLTKGQKKTVTLVSGSTGVGGIAAITWYGTRAYSLKAEVVAIEEKIVWVTYIDSDGVSKKIDLRKNANKAHAYDEWYIGEEIELFFVNFRGLLAAERGNGSVFDLKKQTSIILRE